MANQQRSFFSILNSVFGISGPVSRSLYATVGFSLMAAKYIIEATTIFLVTQQFYSPLAFIMPSFTLREQYFRTGPDWLPWFLIIWSIPFAWIAFTMSARRSIDMNASPFLGILVLIPIINLPVMVGMALAPRVDPNVDLSDVPPRAAEQIENEKVANKTKLAFIYSAFLGVIVGGALALFSTILSAYALHSYGSSLFIAMPIVSGTVAGFVFNQPSMRGIGASFLVGAMSVCIGGCGMLLFAMEGVICLAMAAPMILPVGGLGGMLGWGLAKTILMQSKWMLGGALLLAPLLVPFLATVENKMKTYREYVVESSVIVDGTAEEVWQNVVSFPDITTPPAWYFRWGVASPLRARIIGSGVGAVRHCEFTTGSFIEPITTWDKPSRLAFDVTEQPDPLIELTPYRDVRPPHLQHSFRSVRGEFQLIELADGRTKLIGRTWYTLDMGPRFFWRMWTDEIIHRIHLRVLGHIQEQVE